MLLNKVLGPGSGDRVGLWMGTIVRKVALAVPSLKSLVFLEPQAHFDLSV